MATSFHRYIWFMATSILVIVSVLVGIDHVSVIICR